MIRWSRFEDGDGVRFGIVEGDTIRVHAGDMFDRPVPTGEAVALDAVRLAPPCAPTKIIALWNNFRALSAKLGVGEPPEPLYLLKSTSSVAAPGAGIARPPAYGGRIAFEGELGIVVGRRCANADEAAAAEAIFGYTCVNDLTASDITFADATFPQWARAKSFDGFGPFGPVIAAGLDPADLTVRTLLDGAERQNYPVSDMIFAPARLVSLLSRDMTLMPGDLICCGTSLGVGAIKGNDSLVEVVIDGIGTLSNRILQ